MGVMIAPVAGSGSWPTWMARVSKSIRSMLVMWPVTLPGSRVASTKRCKDAGSVQSRGQVQLLLAGLPPDSLDFEPAGLSVEDRLDPADEAVPVEDGEDVVAVLALRR